MRFSSYSNERQPAGSADVTFDAYRLEGAESFRFADCEIRLASREILRAGVAQKVERLTFDLIVYLVTRCGRVVSKDELLRNVWRNMFVSDSVITQSIMKARRALGDDGGKRLFIRTVHRVGYRFEDGLLRQESANEQSHEAALQLISIARQMRFDEADRETLVKAASAMARELARLGLIVREAAPNERGTFGSRVSNAHPELALHH